LFLLRPAIALTGKGVGSPYRPPQGGGAAACRRLQGKSPRKAPRKGGRGRAMCAGKTFGQNTSGYLGARRGHLKQK